MSKSLFGDSRVVPAPPEEIFALLADPARHSEIDGSGTVQRLLSEPGPMQLGSKFRIAMKTFGVPYRTSNTVVEFEENRRIAWSYWAKHRWRYELEPVEGGTLVTESVDFSHTRLRPIYMLIRAGERVEKYITATLDSLVERFSA